MNNNIIIGNVFIIFSILLLTLTSSFGQTTNSSNILYNYNQLLDKENQEIKLFGTIARHYELEKEPLVLLLPNDKWIFLGNRDLIDSINGTRQVIITGKIQFNNRDFNFSELEYIENPFRQPDTTLNAEEIIRESFVFESITSIEPVYKVTTVEDVYSHAKEWNIIYGRFKKKGNFLSFSISKRKSSLKFKIPRLHDALPQKGLGYIVLKFDTTNNKLKPKECALQIELPTCKTTDDIEKNYGEIAAVRVKKVRVRFPVVKKMTFYRSDKINFYMYNPIDNSPKRMWVIDRIINIWEPAPFHYISSSSSVGSYVFFGPIWYDKL